MLIGQLLRRLANVGAQLCRLETHPGPFYMNANRPHDLVPPGCFPGTIYYRTKDGKADYGFSFEEQSDGSWRAFILSQPPYGRRDEGAHPTHRLSDGGRKYVCWTDLLSTEKAARQVAAMWADATQRYIRDGTTF